MSRAIVAEKNYELAVYKNPKVGHKPPTLGPLPYQLLVWGGGAQRPEREPSPSGRSMLLGVLPCRR